ncbi:hypothetical protein COL154_007600 [Colletotrichum chrysophilum]|uniref:Uncharacterized protein n=1 Tax=Colletotrichum chrysophilum TaxID=1836956 RepID=A0AAD9APD7_9PEZI|nr:uncharacterized protein COL26b_002729 [Colletotrichum chrysophilum]KAJ0346970.1 hypothetical protein KNSL1_006942 [Colletotrichum chrysophilum]KAJ0360340.1 hypothetical protein COL154_007600 [Colletotrichum chrysophilum]KAJ0378952.1 hypothetical protein COL26b_002729 [Colletotrichum chrysophilum]KAK1851951.1 hypothetical protein CCHR01_05384 [Colletotrichum chrysophilum]
MNLDTILIDGFNITRNPEKASVRYLRVESGFRSLDLRLREFWSHDLLVNHPALQALDIHTRDLLDWTQWIEENYQHWSVRSRVRIINVDTGEYLNDVNSGPYSDWYDTHIGGREPTRVTDETDEERMQAMRLYGHPLPVADLSRGIE